MAVTHGRKQVVQLDNGAGVLTNITSYLSQASFERLREMAETTVFSNDNKTYIPGLRDATFSGEGRFDPTLDLILSDDINDDTNTKTLQYDPQGSTSGLPRYSVECWVSSYNIDGPLDDVSGISFELQCTGAVTRSTIP